MAEYYKFFDSSADDERVYSASDFAGYYAMFYSNGIINTATYPNSLEVTVKNNSTLTVSPGCAIVNGYQYINDGSIDIAVSGNGYIVLRLDPTERKISAISVVTPNASGYTEVILTQYQTTNGVLKNYNQRATYAEALYTHDFEELKASIETTKENVDNTLPTIEGKVDAKLNEIIPTLKDEIIKVDGPDSGIDADLLDEHEGSYYLDYENFTNAPKILSGTTEPTTADGNDGDIYVMYEE